MPPRDEAPALPAPRGNDDAARGRRERDLLEELDADRFRDFDRLLDLERRLD